MNTKEENIKMARELKLFGQTINDAAIALKNSIQVIKPIKRLAGSPSGNDLSSKLIAAGMMCIAFPEPVISDITGTILVAAGVALKKRCGPTIADIFKETGKIVSNLRKMSQKI